MIVSLDIDKTRVDAFMDAMPRQIFEASAFAVSEASKRGRTQLVGEMKSKLDIPANVWRRWRTSRRYRRNTAFGVVWLGVNELKAAYAGKLRQADGGAYSGKRFFKGSFVATMKSGHEGIFKRTGDRKKLANGKWWTKIEEETVDVDLGFEVIEDVARQTRIELDRLFIAKVLELNPHLGSG